MILRAMSPPATSRAPAPSPNSEAVLPLMPPVAGSCGAPLVFAAGEAGAALASAPPALATPLGSPTVCLIVVVHEASPDGVTLISLAEKSISSVLVLYWLAPCSFKTLPVFTSCATVGHKLTLLPVLLTSVLGEAVPLLLFRSENGWSICAKAGAAATTNAATIAPNNINFFIFSPSFSCLLYLPEASIASSTVR